ncbi:hypothetical protein P280DRAFT_446488 [Massarina eburnea CBS 473.64]|uniref:C2H2-type domain-containing protein n=1 Tax=Massarina eburnea CBS 473.64 TaxID=1395130 RepID=A0A6A6S6C3_9PLEO|nr:hypothetical protein P280DRAFT_446488 [Massarina eburnea CBS 473.64]
MLSTSTNYLCNTCQVPFLDGQEQRIHMKDPWHIYNLKRRIASLPPISLHTFNTKVKKKVDISEASTGSSSEEDTSETESEQSASPFQCLFCSQRFATDDAGFANNLEHMHTVHGMFIPDPESVIDMQSFIGYLATEVRTWHECLYCGATKPSTLSIQSHMRDKGHCFLNLDREPELLDFWDSPPGDGAVVLEQARPAQVSDTEMHLASGKIIVSRHGASATKRASRKWERGLATSTRALPPVSGAESPPPSTSLIEPQLAPGRQIARREELGIIGISVQQRQALVLAEKKAQRSEAVARRAREWVYAQGANSQEFDQINNQRKWGKQNHKLLPR